MNLKVACQILKLQQDCSVEELKSAFRKLSLQFHPDKNKNKSPGASEKFVQIKQAYEFLLKLKMDDPNSDSSSTQNQPPPIEFKLDLTLEEIFSGCTRKEKIYRRVLDEYGIVDKMEEKILDVKVKPGILAGTRITIKNQGDIHHNKIPANVVFIVREKPHELFIRSKFNLKYTAIITSEDAFFGCDIQIPTLDSKVSRLLIHNEKIDEKTEKRFVGLGMPIPDNPEKRGHIIVNFKIVHFQSNPGNSPNKKQLPPNKRILNLTLDEIFHGYIRTEKIKIKITLKNENKREEEKTLQVNVKPGSINGSEIICNYAGDMSYGKISADVIFTVIVEQHPIFKTIGHNLVYLAKITSKEAILGGELDIPTLENRLFKYAFSGSVTPETEKLISEMGIPYEGGNRGDLIIKFQILFCKDSKAIEPIRLREKLSPNRFDLNLTLEELFYGVKMYQKISIKIIDQNGNEKEEEKCLKIKLKPGSFDDIIFPSMGDREYGKITTDVIFSIVDEPHALFKRNGYNLEYKAQITPKEAIFGGDLLIPTLEGGEVNLTLNKSITPSTIMSIPGKGFSIPNTDGQRGDIVVLFEIVFVQEVPNESPVEHYLLITLEQFLHGCKKTISIHQKAIDSNGVQQIEKKIFKLDIKPGTETGSRFIFPRESDQIPEKIPADVVFVVREKPHELFTRNGANLEHFVTLTESEFKNGGNIKIPTLGNDDPKQILLGTISGKNAVKTFTNCGLPFPEKPEKRGNLVVRFNIIEALTDPQDDPITIDLEVTFEQILTGSLINKTINQKTFDSKGNQISSEDVLIEIPIEIGTMEETTFCFDKLGPKHFGRRPADLIFVVRHKAHEYFTPSGSDVWYYEKITVDEAKDDIELEIPTLDNKTFKKKFTNISYFNNVFKFEYLGLPISGNLDKRGDLLVQFKIVSNYLKDTPTERYLRCDFGEIYFGCAKNVKISRSKFDSDGLKYTEEKDITVHIPPLGRNSTKHKVIFPRLGDQTGLDRIPGDLVVTAFISKFKN